MLLTASAESAIATSRNDSTGKNEGFDYYSRPTEHTMWKQKDHDQSIKTWGYVSSPFYILPSRNPSKMFLLHQSASSYAVPPSSSPLMGYSDAITLQLNQRSRRGHVGGCGCDLEKCTATEEDIFSKRNPPVSYSPPCTALLDPIVSILRLLQFLPAKYWPRPGLKFKVCCLYADPQWRASSETQRIGPGLFMRAPKRTEC